jgi:hypothetical protein
MEWGMCGGVQAIRVGILWVLLRGRNTMSKLIDSVNAADKSLRELLSTVSVEGKDCTCVFLALTLVESVKKELEQGERGDELKKMVEGLNNFPNVPLKQYEPSKLSDILEGMHGGRITKPYSLYHTFFP